MATAQAPAFWPASSTALRAASSMVAAGTTFSDGTNAEEGRALLAGSPSDKVIPAATMLDAARKAVELADHRAGA